MKSIILVLLNSKEDNLLWNSETSRNAAYAAEKLDPKFKVFKFLIENKCPWNSNTSVAVAESGNAECLRYALSKNCPQDTDIAYCSCENTNLEMMHLCDQYNCKFTYECYSAVIDSGKDNIIECLNFLVSINCPKRPKRNVKTSSDNFKSVLKNDNIDLLKFIIDNELENKPFKINKIIDLNAIKCFEYLVSKEYWSNSGELYRCASKSDISVDYVKILLKYNVNRNGFILMPEYVHDESRIFLFKCGFPTIEEKPRINTQEDDDYEEDDDN